MCQICSKSVEFYKSYGKTHFGVFFMPHSVHYLYSAEVLEKSGCVKETLVLLVVFQQFAMLLAKN